MRLSTVACVALLAATAAAAESSPADGCAAGLGKDSRAIYDASVAAVQPTTDLKELLTEKTRSLVWAGTIERGGARDAARAASECLKLRVAPASGPGAGQKAE